MTTTTRPSLRTTLDLEQDTKKRGRPLLDKRRQRDHQIQFRVTEEEMDMIKRQANKYGMKVTAYIVTILQAQENPDTMQELKKTELRKQLADLLEA